MSDAGRLAGLLDNRYEPVLAQHGIDDTTVDVLFNTLGALLVATWGTVYLAELSEVLATHPEDRV